MRYILVFCLLAALLAPVHAGECRDAYAELAGRTIASLADYKALERDFVALNVMHGRRMPPRDLNVTEDTWRENATKLIAGAHARAQADWCP